MKNMGMDIKTISAVTGMPEEEIKNINQPYWDYDQPEYGQKITPNPAIGFGVIFYLYLMYLFLISTPRQPCAYV